MSALPIKELAGELRETPHRIYRMHASGLPMAKSLLPGYGRREVLTATPEQVREWKDANEFRFIHGRAVVTHGQLRLGLQVDLWKEKLGSGKTRQSQIA